MPAQFSGLVLGFVRSHWLSCRVYRRNMFPSWSVRYHPSLLFRSQPTDCNITYDDLVADLDERSDRQFVSPKAGASNYRRRQP
jgi:hypothetical protein